MTVRIRAFEHGDFAISEKLVREAFGATWFPVDWGWRYSEHPTPVDMWVLETEDAVVGFASAVARHVRLGPDTVVKAMVLGDLVLDPDVRGLGLGRQAVRDGIVTAIEAHPDAAIGLVWARRELVDGIYDPAVGVARPPPSVVRYTCVRSWNRTLERLHGLPALPSTPIRFEMEGMPSLTVGPNGAQLDLPPDPSNRTVRVRRNALGLFRGRRSVRYRRLGKALLRGDVHPVGVRSWWALLREGPAVTALLAVLAG